MSKIISAPNFCHSESVASPARRALLAETDPVIRKQCFAVLRQSGFDINQVETGLAALVAVRDHCPDVILIATQLRDCTGHEAIEWLRANPALARVPIILLSDDGDPGSSRPAAQPTARLRKPISPAAIRKLLADL